MSGLPVMRCSACGAPLLRRKDGGLGACSAAGCPDPLRDYDNDWAEAARRFAEVAKDFQGSPTVDALVGALLDVEHAAVAATDVDDLREAVVAIVEAHLGKPPRPYLPRLTGEPAILTAANWRT